MTDALAIQIRDAQDPEAAAIYVLARQLRKNVLKGKDKTAAEKQVAAFNARRLAEKIERRKAEAEAATPRENP